MKKYKVLRIPKQPGKFRTIYAPDSEYRAELRTLLPALRGILARADDCCVNYAFERGKNSALNALQHIGRRFTLTMDLEDFFDSVRGEHLSDIVPEEIIQECCIGGAPRQGLPTSPLLATIAFLACDRQILRLLRASAPNVVYTRYADDLAFSADDRVEILKVRAMVPQLLERFGFKINRRKTSLQDAKNGRRIITGVAVDDHGLHATRRTKKKIRAAIHQQNDSSGKGLLEWAACKLPGKYLVDPQAS